MKRTLTTTFAAAGLLAIVAPARAQHADILVTDTAVDQLVWITDKNLDGDYNDFMDDESVSLWLDESSSARSRLPMRFCTSMAFLSERRMPQQSKTN